jgi:hypothetical protein
MGEVTVRDEPAVERLNAEDSQYNRMVIAAVDRARAELYFAESVGDHWFRDLMERYGLVEQDSVDQDGVITRVPVMAEDQ